MAVVSCIAFVLTAAGEPAQSDLAKQFVAMYGPPEMQNMSFSVSNGSGWATDIGNELATRYVANYDPVSESHAEFSDDFKNKYVPSAYSEFLQYQHYGVSAESWADGSQYPGGNYWHQYAKSWYGGKQPGGVQLPGYPGGNYWNPYGNSWTNDPAADEKNGKEMAKQFVKAYAPKEAYRNVFNLTNGTSQGNSTNMKNGSSWAHDMGMETARRFMKEYMPAASDGSTANFTAEYVPAAYQGFIKGSWNPSSFSPAEAAVSDLSASMGNSSGAAFGALLLGVLVSVIALANIRQRQQVSVDVDSSTYLLA